MYFKIKECVADDVGRWIIIYLFNKGKLRILIQSFCLVGTSLTLQAMLILSVVGSLQLGCRNSFIHLIVSCTLVLFVG